MSPVASRSLDFSNVKESTGINPKHVEEGEYLAKITSVTEQDAKDGTPMWLFIVTPDDHRSAAYPYYCKLQENQLWKVRNLFISAGLSALVAGKSKVKLNPNKLIGKSIGIVLEDDEYEGKMKSVIEAVMPASDLEDGGIAADPDIDDDEEDDEEEVVAAPVKKHKAAPVVEEEEDDEEEEVVVPAKKAKKAKAAPVVEEEDDEEEEEEVAPPKKTRKAKAKPAPVEDDEDDEEDEAPVSKRTAARRAAKKAVAKAPAADEDDDDDDELDLDDI